MVNTNKIKGRIVEFGLTQEKVAQDMLGMDYTTFNLKLNNKRRFYLDEIVKLSKGLNITSKEELKEYFGLDFLIVNESCENDTKGL